MTTATSLWRRLDSPGHDACRLTHRDDQYRIDGTAVFLHDATPARLTYEVTCDSAWYSREGRVHGWLGAKSVDFVVRHVGRGSWMLNGAPVAALEGCVDLDLGFTPSTNALQLNRVALDVGQGADVPVAWLDIDTGELSLLHQRYERQSVRTYWYEAPRFDYAAILEVDDSGFPRRYPGLWEAER